MNMQNQTGTHRSQREPGRKALLKIPANGGTHSNSLKHTTGCYRHFQKVLSTESYPGGGAFSLVESFPGTISNVLKQALSPKTGQNAG